MGCRKPGANIRALRLRRAAFRQPANVTCYRHTLDDKIRHGFFFAPSKKLEKKRTPSQYLV
jgi:hypothetical protein